jgi:hypothetical protein
MSNEEKRKQIIERIDEINNAISEINNITATDIDNYFSTGTNPNSEKKRLENEKGKLERDLINLENGCSNSGCTVSGGRRYKKKKPLNEENILKKIINQKKVIENKFHIYYFVIFDVLYYFSIYNNI